MKKSTFLIAAAFATGLAGSFSASAQLVYKDVAGIFYNRCTPCHHPNGGAPFSMLSYSETTPWTSMIKADLNSGKMPPWPPDTAYTRFLHERIITSTEKSDIISWINSGALAGDTTLAPAPPVYTAYHLGGTPDLILKVPAFASNASSKDAYNCFALPTGLTVDRVIRALEIVPSNPAILHHTVINVDTTGTVNSDLSGGCYAEAGQFGIGGYAPGTPPTVFPSQGQLKMGIRIKAGSKIILQQHYPTGSAGQIDSTELRLYFYPTGTTGIRPVHVQTVLQNWLFSIPANTTQYVTATSNASVTATPISIYAVNPHGHHVNRNMLIYAYRTSPADTIKLISIPKWDFNWQGFYTFPKMIKVPAGYKLFTKHLYDNTTNNPDNPNNPPQTVSAGTSTKDEMLFDSFQFLDYQAGDENILVDTSYVNPLSSEGSVEPAIASYVYPNPVTESATLIVTNAAAANCTLKVFDMYGKEVPVQVARTTDAFVICRSNLPSGVYFYSLRAGRSVGSGKLVITPDK